MLDIRIDTAGTLERLQREMAAMPEGVERAKKRAMRKLGKWVGTRVLRYASRAAGVTAKTLKELGRYDYRATDDGISVWLGTNAIPAHHLGTVNWTRRMTGARAGKRLFPHTWSWPSESGIRTAGLIMRRTGAFGRWRNPKLEVIAKVDYEIHVTVFDAVQAVMPEVENRFRTLLVQELNYALLHEAAR